MSKVEDIVINCDDIMSTDEHDVQPEFVEASFNEDSLKTIARAIQVLRDNQDIDSLSISNINWNVNDDFEGKAGYGRLVISINNGKPLFSFRFANDWTGTEYFVDFLDEIAKPLVDAGPLGKNWVDIEDLEEWYGKTIAEKLFEEFKSKKPTYQISPDFAMQIIGELPKGFASFNRADFGLENEDSEHCLQWCEIYYLDIESINSQAFVEVGDNHYYVDLWRDGSPVDTSLGGETFRHWDDIAPYIMELVNELKEKNNT